VMQNDHPAVTAQQWHHHVLGEGHVINNAQAKLTKAVKTVRARHRLVQSGLVRRFKITNNARELWSLFDFLMPGFLGTESFNERFGKPITSSCDAKSSNKVKEAGETPASAGGLGVFIYDVLLFSHLALEALHKQALPLLLRRLKEDVLHDLNLCSICATSVTSRVGSEDAGGY
jgi:TATA-binding protein-associated factor